MILMIFSITSIIMVRIRGVSGTWSPYSGVFFDTGLANWFYREFLRRFTLFIFNAIDVFLLIAN